MRVLVITHGNATAEATSTDLAENGFAVTSVKFPPDLDVLVELDVDAVLLDFQPTHACAIQAIRNLRKAGVVLPILALSASESIRDQVELLEAGADDFIAAPAKSVELMARLKAISRRYHRTPHTDAQIQIAGLVMNRTTREVWRGETRLDLLPREYEILELLMTNPGQLVSRSILLKRIWGYRWDPGTSLIQTHLSRLRSKVDKPFGGHLIQTVRGRGYAITVH